MKLEAQRAKPVLLTCHSDLRKLYTEPTNFNEFSQIVLEKMFLIGQSQARTVYGGY